MTTRLPERPNLSHLKKQAKELLNKLSLENPKFKLSQAQYLLAKQYGFESWPKLKVYVEHVTARSPRPLNRSLLRAIEALRAGDQKPS